MKKIKIILLIIITFIISGCSVDSFVEMNYDGSVTENVKVLDDNSNFEVSSYDKKTQIEFALENYIGILDFKNYTYDTLVGKKQSGAKITKKYDNICDYFEDTAFNQYVYKSIKCEESNDYYEIYNYTNYIPYCEGCSDWPRLENVKFSIKLPIRAAESNADDVDGTTYLWKYDKNTFKDKEFYLKINKKDLEENKIKIEKELKIKRIIKQVVTIFSVLIFIFLLIFIILKFIKKYKDNKLEYGEFQK